MWSGCECKRASECGVCVSRCNRVFCDIILSNRQTCTHNGPMNECESMRRKCERAFRPSQLKACLLLCVQWHNSEKSISDEFCARLNVARTLAAILSTFDFCVIPNLLSRTQFFLIVVVAVVHFGLCACVLNGSAYQRTVIKLKQTQMIISIYIWRLKMLDFKLNNFWHFLWWP